VGGTLWPNTWPLTPALERDRRDAVAAALGADPTTGAATLTAIVEVIDEGVAAAATEPVEHIIERVLAVHDYHHDAAAIRSVRQALCVNLGRNITPFPGAQD